MSFQFNVNYVTSEKLIFLVKKQVFLYFYVVRIGPWLLNLDSTWINWSQELITRKKVRNNYVMVWYEKRENFNARMCDNLISSSMQRPAICNGNALNDMSELK